MNKDVGLETWKFEVHMIMGEGELGEENDIQAYLHYLYFSHRVVTGSSTFCELAGYASISSD